MTLSRPVIRSGNCHIIFFVFVTARHFEFVTTGTYTDTHTCLTTWVYVQLISFCADTLKTSCCIFAYLIYLLWTVVSSMLIFIVIATTAFVLLKTVALWALTMEGTFSVDALITTTMWCSVALVDVHTRCRVVAQLESNGANTQEAALCVVAPVTAFICISSTLAKLRQGWWSVANSYPTLRKQT